MEIWSDESRQVNSGAMMSERDSNSTNNFDSLRLIFAVLVILSHAYPLGKGSNATEPLYMITRGQTTIGNLSVWGFFVISGYLITQSWLRSPSVIRFLKRRIGRIYPGFIVASLVTAVVIVPIAADAHTYTRIFTTNFLSNTFRLQLFAVPPVFTKNASANALNGSLWSIAYEFWCYLGVMALGVCGLLRRRSLVLMLFLCAVIWHLYMDVTGWNPGGRILGEIFGYPLFWATVLPFFLAGMLLQLFGGRILVRAPIVICAVLTLIASYFVPHGIIVTLPMCGAYTLLALGYLPALNFLNLGRYGDFSYGVYLHAFPIEQLVVMTAGGSMNPLKLFAIAWPISLVAGSLSWFLVEKHFLSKPAQLKHEGKQTS